MIFLDSPTCLKSLMINTNNDMMITNNTRTTGGKKVMKKTILSSFCVSLMKFVVGAIFINPNILMNTLSDNNSNNKHNKYQYFT